MDESGALPESEAELVDLLTEHANTLWSRPEVRLETASPGGGRADVSILSNGRIYSVEAKLEHWRRAIGQAVLNRYWSDRCYIALWHSKVNEQVTDEARRFGLGVIAVHPSGARKILGAQQCTPHRALKEKVVQLFTSRQG